MAALTTLCHSLQGLNYALGDSVYVLSVAIGVIRLRDGDSWEGVEFPVSNEPGLYLLYGPSVDQVFDDVAEEISPSLAREMDNEFHRQFALLI